MPEHPKDKALANGLANAISEDCKERRLLCVQSLLFMSANFVSKDRVDLQTNRGALQTRPQNLQKNLLTKKVIGHNTIPFKMLMCDKVTLEFDRQQPIIPILYFDAENSIIHSINYVIIGAANLANKYV